MPSEQWVIPGALIFLSGITSSKSGNPASLRTFGSSFKSQIFQSFSISLTNCNCFSFWNIPFFLSTSISVLPISILILLPVLFTGGSNERGKNLPQVHGRQKKASHR